VGVVEVLEEGARTLSAISAHLLDRFNAAEASYARRHAADTTGAEAADAPSAAQQGGGAAAPAGKARRKRADAP
jgi:hypothetical protein